MCILVQYHTSHEGLIMQLDVVFDKIAEINMTKKRVLTGFNINDFSKFINIQ